MSVFYLNKTSSFQIQCTGSLQRCPCRNVLTVANMKCYQVHHCSCLSLKCHGKRLLMVSHIIWKNWDICVLGEQGRVKASWKGSVLRFRGRVRGSLINETQHFIDCPENCYAQRNCVPSFQLQSYGVPRPCSLRTQFKFGSASHGTSSLKARS